MDSHPRISYSDSATMVRMQVVDVSISIATSHRNLLQSPTADFKCKTADVENSTPAARRRFFKVLTARIVIRYRLPRSTNGIDPELVGMSWPVRSRAEHSATCCTVGRIATKLMVHRSHCVLGYPP